MSPASAGVTSPLTRRVTGRTYRPGHCGILDAYFAGRLWRANPALSDGSGNPPRGWEDPESLGTMRLIRTNLAEFQQSKTLVARLTPAPRHWKTITCD